MHRADCESIPIFDFGGRTPRWFERPMVVLNSVQVQEVMKDLSGELPVGA
jgi:hypothetical protein